MKSTALFCMTRLRGMQVADGHAMSYTLNFQEGKYVKFGGLILAPTTLHIQGQSVPILGGELSPHKE